MAIVTRAPLPPGVVSAPPLWALSAEHNRERMASAARQREARETVAALVTKHPAPWFGEAVTASARTLERLALSKGMTTLLRSGLEGCVLEGRKPSERVGFRASWRRGKAETAQWFSPAEEWRTVPDTRPIGVSKISRTVLAGHRDGHSNTRTILVSSPAGVVVSFAEIGARLRALG